MKGYSTEYSAVLAMFLSPLLGNYLSDACAGEVSTIVAGMLIAGASGLFLLVKRYSRGGVTAIGSRV